MFHAHSAWLKTSKPRVYKIVQLTAGVLLGFQGSPNPGIATSPPLTRTPPHPHPQPPPNPSIRVTGVEKNTHKRALPSRKAKHKTRRDVRLGPKTKGQQFFKFFGYLFDPEIVEHIHETCWILV